MNASTTPTCEERERRAILLSLRDQVHRQFELLAQRSVLAPFLPPHDSNQVLTASAYVLSTCSLIILDTSGTTPATAQEQALAMWWVALFCVGGKPSEGVRLELQNLRGQQGGGWFSSAGSKARARVKALMNACEYARGLLKVYLQAPPLAVAVACQQEVNDVEKALTAIFGFEKAKMDESDLNPALRYLNDQ